MIFKNILCTYEHFFSEFFHFNNHKKTSTVYANFNTMTSLEWIKCTKLDTILPQWAVRANVKRLLKNVMLIVYIINNYKMCMEKLSSKTLAKNNISKRKGQVIALITVLSLNFEVELKRCKVQLYWTVIICNILREGGRHCVTLLFKLWI